MRITIDPKTKKATVEFSCEVDLAAALRTEEVLQFVVTDKEGQQVLATLSEEKAKRISRAYEGSTIKKVESVRRLATDSDIVSLLRRKMAAAFVAKSVATEITLPPI